MEMGGLIPKQRYIRVFYLFSKNPDGRPQKSERYTDTWNPLESLRDLGVRSLDLTLEDKRAASAFGRDVV